MKKARVVEVTFAEECPTHSAIWLYRFIQKTLLNELNVRFDIQAELLRSDDSLNKMHFKKGETKE